MTREQLALYKQEYKDAMSLKKDRLHQTWGGIIAEYRLNNFWGVHQYIDDLVMTDPTNLLATDGRTGHLNVYVRKFVSLLNMARPEFLMDNEMPGQEPFAWVIENVFNQLCRHLKMSRVSRKLALQAALFGTGIAKVGYSSEFMYSEDAWSGDLPSGMDIGSEKMWPYGDTTEYRLGRSWNGKPSVLAVPAPNIFFNPGCYQLDDVRRIFHRTTRRVVDCVHDERYLRKSRKQIFGHVNKDIDERTYLTTVQDDELLKEVRTTDIVEVFDLASRKFCVINEESDLPLRDWTDFPLDIDCPYHFYQPIPDPESCWGIPYALLFFQQVQAHNQLRAITIDSIGRDSKKVILANSNVFDEEKVAEMNHAKNHEWVSIDGVDRDADLSRAYAVVDFGGVNPDLLQLQSLIMDDMTMMTGLDDPSRNFYRPGGNTATEINARAEQQGLSISDMRDEFEEFLEDVAGSLCKVMLQNWDEKQVVKFVGEDPRLYFWVAIDRQRLLGNFNLRINVGTTEKIDKATYRRQLIDLLPRILELGQSIDAEAAAIAQAGAQPSPLNRQELLREVLESFDPRLSNKILRRRDPSEVLNRLMDSGVPPMQVSPMLTQQLGASGPPAVPGVPGASFEEANRIPAPAEGNQFGGGFQQDTGAGIGGRMLSEGQFS